MLLHMEGKTVYHFNEDAAMVEAYDRARGTFRYLWREISWERRRIVPGLDLACVKTVFADRPLDDCGPEDAREQMWVRDFDFDGRVISGTLVNRPDNLRSLKQGDKCSFPYHQMTDWMYAIRGRAYGAWTVNLMRQRMQSAERRAHDEAWGLDFGDPAKVEVVPADWRPKKKGLLGGLFGTAAKQAAVDPDDDHPMCVNMEAKLKIFLEANPKMISEKDERGWTMLHREALAGNSLVVKALLERGANGNARTAEGDRPADLARRMGGTRVVAVLGD